ncbi:transposase [soil metagenome]
MSQYKRCYIAGGHYFLTLVTFDRKPILTIPENIERLKNAIQKVKQRHPFSINAMVILPDHLHCLWKLPENDQDFSTRVRLIKRYFSMEIPMLINHRQEKQVWQRRFWEHVIQNEDDWRNHMDYIHYNPVKHRYVQSVKEWQHSTFSYWVQKKLSEEHWETSEPLSINMMNKE